MNRKNQIYEVFLQSKEQGFTAIEISQKLNLDRANVSSDLNKLVKEGSLVKTNSRPVVFKLQSHTLQQTNHFQNNPANSEYKYEYFYEENISLRPAIEKARSAILYPPNGMHTLILGETGVGKSAFAARMHDFAIRSNVLRKDSPFIIFNCADYANNPQLLLGQLFGVRKGAYTGATEQKGLLEKANNGILFLDEVHRLTPEGQEMLFTFIDYKLYRRLGETENERTSNVLIISATTEDPSSTLLSTFTRRIPMVITLPALRDRTYDERFTLIKRFFSEESLRLGKEIVVSANTIRSFLFYPCQNNIGQLKADIQLACAKAYADFITHKHDKIRIHSTDLNWYVKEGLFIEKKVKHSITLLNEYFEFSPTKGIISNPQMDHSADTIYDRIDTKYEELKQRGVNQDELSLLMENDIESYFTHYITSINRKLSSKENVQKIIKPEIVTLSEKVLKLAEEKLNKRFNEKILVALSLHIQTLLQRIQSNKKIHHPNITQIRDQYKNEFSVSIECVKMIEDFSNVSIPFDEVAFITMFFVYGNEDFKVPSSNVKVIVLAHGSGIAREMANVTNELLENEEVIGIDMPLSEPPQDFLIRVKDYIKSLGKLNGILLCIDMGSLAYIGDIIEAEFSIPVRVIQMVSTAHVIEASRKATLGYSLDELYQDVRNLTTFFINSHANKTKQPEFNRSVILTACLTGQGSAIAIKNILANNLVYDKEMLEIVPISLLNKEELQKMLNDISKERSIVCIVSNFDISVPFNTFHLQDVLNMKATKKIQELITYEETYLKMAETLQETISLKDAKKVISVIRRALNDIQVQTDKFFKNEDLMGIVIHMSCMIDRIQNSQPLIPFKDKEDKINSDYLLYLKIKKILQQIEESCDIIIPDDEICYLMEFYSRNDKEQEEQKKESNLLK
ncbi:sigma 54-interacting transcriptional regulator [Bacillus sp. AFS017336]|uniref:sigma 54-interacting transcriptional regulator n=1 Tax=Bacillus sp. AFS017336 TaxID=2033489 RepID=UPI000BF21344|nr:sigma-54-dependent transcriptional regulator [Bacillus sp. AFS017336]PEL08204.1 transcription antiterminator BglG [Bacillus sp. AFS017336]